MFISSCLLHTNIPHSGMLYLSNNTCALGEDAEVREDSELTGSDPGFCQISIDRSIPASLLFIWCRVQDQGRAGWMENSCVMQQAQAHSQAQKILLCPINNIMLCFK